MKEGWELKKLGEVCNIIGGGTPSKTNANFYIGDIPWATVRDMNFDLLKKTEYCISAEAVKKSSTNIIPTKNVIIASRVGLGKVCLLNQDTAINQDLRGIIPINNKLTPKYLFYWFKNISDFIIKNGKGATVHGVNLVFLKSLEIPVSPISEQLRIVEILDTAFEKIETVKQNAERNLQNTKQLFQSVLDFELSLKKGWTEKKLSDITEVKDGTHDSPKYIQKGIPFVTQKNIKLTGLNFDDTKFITDIDHEKFYKRSDVSYGDILISMIGANRGMAAIVDEKRIFSIKNVGLIKKSENINQYFLLYFLKSPIAMKYVLDNSNGGAQEFIGLTSLRKFPIPYAPLSEQQQIVSKLDALSAKCKELENNYLQTINDCDELKKAILAKAFNGEL